MHLNLLNITQAQPYRESHLSTILRTAFDSSSCIVGYEPVSHRRVARLVSEDDGNSTSKESSIAQADDWERAIVGYYILPKIKLLRPPSPSPPFLLSRPLHPLCSTPLTPSRPRPRPRTSSRLPPSSCIVEPFLLHRPLGDEGRNGISMDDGHSTSTSR
jgi:hypothetical protein